MPVLSGSIGMAFNPTEEQKKTTFFDYTIVKEKEILRLNEEKLPKLTHYG